jgi:hypothetical protein
MSGLVVTFRGLCLSSVAGAKTGYTKFAVEPSIGVAPVEFQVACKDTVEPEFVFKMADWELKNFAPVSGTNKEGKQFAFFKCDAIKGELVKEKLK